MLNPPLSLLSDDLLNEIVDHVAGLPDSNSDIYNLSFTDRAFTRSCQAYIFKDLNLGHVSYSYGVTLIISWHLEKIRNILNDKPSLANLVRTVHLTGLDEQNRWFFNDPDFITIIQHLSKSPMPPHELYFGRRWETITIEDPILVVEWLRQSFFSQTLTVLNLNGLENVPLSLFLVCPNLRKVYLDYLEVFDSSDDEYPDAQCSDRKLPALEYLRYRYSESLVKQMITPPPNFSKVVDWSKLRVLVLYAQDKEGLMCLQPILDIVCQTLEELHLTYDIDLQLSIFRWMSASQRSLTGLVDLRHLSNLHIFAIHAHIKYEAHEHVVSRDINPILSTIPDTNQVTELSFRFNIYAEHTCDGCPEQDWVGMCEEVVRVSSGKPLELFIEWSTDRPEDERVKERIAAYLSDYPNISAHLWQTRRRRTLII